MENTGKNLSKKWEININHALYRADGKWYHLLRDFPGALLDKTGYVIFETESEYLNCPELNIKQHIHVPSGISSIATYVFRGDIELEASDVEEPDTPDRKSYSLSRIIRDSAIARKIKALHNHTCQLCENRLLLNEDKAYAEAHHIKPLGMKHNGPDSQDNIICVCPNCHALLDYGAIPINHNDLKAHPQHTISTKNVDYHNKNIFKLGTTFESEK